MIKEYQVTLIAKNGMYKPVSCIIKAEDGTDKKTLLIEGTKKIAMKRYWTGADLKKYTYTSGKVREYDREKIAKENAERYERIKEEKYASGEWQRPTTKG